MPSTDSVIESSFAIRFRSGIQGESISSVIHYKGGYTAQTDQRWARPRFVRISRQNDWSFNGSGTQEISTAFTELSADCGVTVSTISGRYGRAVIAPQRFLRPCAEVTQLLVATYARFCKGFRLLTCQESSCHMRRPWGWEGQHRWGGALGRRINSDNLPCPTRLARIIQALP